MSNKKLSALLVVAALALSALALANIVQQARALSVLVEFEGRQEPSVTRCEIDPLVNTPVAVISVGEDC